MTNERKRQAVLEGLRQTMAVGAMAGVLLAGTTAGAIAKAVEDRESMPSLSDDLPNRPDATAKVWEPIDIRDLETLEAALQRCVGGFLQFCQ